VDSLGDLVQVAVGGVVKAGEERLQALMVLGLAGRAKSAESASVKTIEHADDLVSAAGLAVEPGQLDRRLHRLGAAVAEKAFAVPPGPLAQGLGQEALRLGVPG